MDYYYEIAAKSSYHHSLKLLESDIHHANALAASIPRGNGGSCFQMKLVYDQLAPICLLLLQWMDCSYSCLLSTSLNLFHILVYQVCSDGKPKISTCTRKATIREFYAVILPSLQCLHGGAMELDRIQDEGCYVDTISKKRVENRWNFLDMDVEREDECGICLEPCTKMVVPSCCHAMCINCYRDWNTRSESCPFCRGSLKRVNSSDLWVLTCNGDVVDANTVLKEDMLRFYVFMNSLPKDIPDALFVMYYEYLI
ncbi:RING/U-box superfamily protein [Euphorbia peplus]|nr:RING/U-box superfamily protein [Euphorbia peplus]